MPLHRELERWIYEMAELCSPDGVIWIDGSESEKRRLEEEAVSTGELIRLNEEVLPGCLYHRTDPNDVARVEHLTFICTSEKVEVGPNNNWMHPEEAYARARDIFKGSMKGRTMYVVPFSMGPVGSPFSKIGVEITDSIYVVLNMRIMCRIGRPVMKALGEDGEFTRCLHSKADLDINRRLILHFPEDNTIWSVGSGYGGNVLLGKKCLGLRLASWMGKQEGWMAEHMLILGIEDPNGLIEYIAAAFPSSCGKTNLAMLVPPEIMRKKGYRVWTVGDDIAWMRIDTDGRLWAVNPEAGCFGVVPGTNAATNPNAMAMISHDTIYTNVVLKDDGTVWWEGHDDPPPDEATDWRGNKWKPGMKDENGKPIPGAHPNSRFTASIFNCPSKSNRIEHHHGVPISAIIFGGRRRTLAPLVYESYSWNHGVYVGSTMASEKTAAATGKLGVIRQDPMAMLPFCGYHLGDYLSHWVDMGKRITRPPRIFHVNWFRKDENGDFLWPGYGENLRVLDWMLRRCRGEVGARETPIGYVPDPKDIYLKGLDISKETMERLVEVDPAEWTDEAQRHRGFFAQFGMRLPDELVEELEALEKRLEEASEK